MKTVWVVIAVVCGVVGAAFADEPAKAKDKQAVFEFDVDVVAHERDVPARLDTVLRRVPALGLIRVRSDYVAQIVSSVDAL